MAQFLHILWNAHLLKDLRLNIINGVRLLNFEHKSLSCPRTKIPRMKTCIISSSKRTGAGVGLAFDFFQTLGSGVLCLVLRRKPSVRRIWKRNPRKCDGACMFGCYLWSSSALIKLIVVRNVDKDPVRVHT